MRFNNIESTTNKYIFKFLIPLFILLSLVYLFFKNLFYIRSFDLVFILSGILIILLSSVTVFSFENGLLLLLFLACVINSLPVIILKIEIIYPLILFAFLGFVLGGIFKTYKIQVEMLYEDYKFELLNIFVILFTLTITVSLFFTILNAFNFFSFSIPEIHIYNTGAADSTSINTLLFSLEMYLNYIITFILLVLLIKRLKITRIFMIKLFYTLFSANIIVFLVFLYQVFIDHSFGNQPHFALLGQINATMLGPNSYGFFLFLNTGIFTTLLFYLTSKRHKIMCMFMLLILPLQVLYSGSRATLIGLAVFSALAIIYFLFLVVINLVRNNKINKNDLLVLVAVFMLLVIIPLSFSLFLLETDILDGTDILKPALLERIGKNLEQVGEEDSLTKLTSGRTFIWPQAIHAIKDYPLTGLGIGNFALELSNYLKLSGFDFTIIDYALNTYLQIFAENGIFSFIFFAGFYVLLFAILFNNLKGIMEIEDRKFIFIMLFIILSCLVMFIFVSGTNYYEGQIIYSFVLILLLLSSYNLKKTEYVKA
jgi:O-antigen ligase